MEDAWFEFNFYTVVQKSNRRRLTSEIFSIDQLFFAHNFVTFLFFFRSHRSQCPSDTNDSGVWDGSTASGPWPNRWVAHTEQFGVCLCVWGWTKLHSEFWSENRSLEVDVWVFVAWMHMKWTPSFRQLPFLTTDTLQELSHSNINYAVITPLLVCKYRPNDLPDH